MKIKNWKNKYVNTIKSKGGVIALRNPFNNFIKIDNIPWPPAEIVQKLSKSNHGKAYRNHKTTSEIGYYSDLQSINSEDAITWNVFGTASYMPPLERNQFITDFFELLDLNFNKIQNSEISLWRRIPHPHNLQPGGPEIDFLIQTDDLVVLGEAKWKSRVGTSQGINKKSDQIQLRINFLEKFGSILFPRKKNYVVLLVGLRSNSVNHYKTEIVNCLSTNWEKDCSLEAHKYSNELQQYLSWKKLHSAGV